MSRDRYAEFFRPGKSVKAAVAVKPKAGMFLLVHGPSFGNRMIRFGEGLRFHGDDKAFSFWNHAAFLVDSDRVVQAHPRGVAFAPLSDFDATPCALVDAKLSQADAAEAVAFVEACVGREYGFLTIASVTLHALTGGKLAVGIDGTEICSGLVACALERGTVVWPGDAAQMTPADLGKAYDVRKPTSW